MKTTSKFQGWTLNLVGLLAIGALLLPNALLADNGTDSASETSRSGDGSQTRNLTPNREAPKPLERKELQTRALDKKALENRDQRAEIQNRKTRTLPPANLNSEKTQRAAGEETKNQNERKAFCQRLENEKTKLSGLANENKDKLRENRELRVETLKDRVEKRGERIDDRRQTFDDRREAQFKKLDDRAQTDAQKQAVSAFRSALETALEAKRSSIDSARIAYQQGLQKLIESRNADLVSAAQTLRAQTEAAFSQAQTDCAANADAKTIRENLQTAVKAAREQFQNQGQNLKSYHDQIKTLQDSRDQAFKKAAANFQAAIEKAKNELKAALQNPS